MGLFILRCVFVMILIGLGVFVLRADEFPHTPGWLAWMTLLIPAAIAAAVIGADVAVRRKQLDVITSVYFGLLVGLFLAYMVGLALIPLPMAEFPRQVLNITLSVIFSYVCISLLLQTRNDFRFIIPYVEFSREVKGSRPFILDTSVVIDGRIADVVETRVFDTQLVMPRFVISELQAIADSSDRLRRSRGRRGLDILNRLRANPEVDLNIHDHDLPEYAGQSVDLKLIALAKHLNGYLVTNDYNLNKVARLHGVPVINLNDVANALKPVFLPGETVQVRIVKPGEEAGQGVGYLEDGTMVVVESGRDHIGEEVAITVTSVLQTSAGRMVFGRFEATRQPTRA